MSNSYIIAVLFSIILAIGTFCALQKAMIEMTHTALISVDVGEVFQVAKDPNHLVHFHFKV